MMSDLPFARFIADAEDIRTSGRWDALNSRIKEMAANPGQENGWYVQTFGQICSKIFIEHNALKLAYEECRGDSALLAWRSRNLLELSVWATYFSQSRDNARRIYEDAGRDARELLDLFERFVQTGTEVDISETPVAAGKADLLARAAQEGITTLDERYLSTHKAAEICGLSDPYKNHSKLMSKFVHPTAMQIIGIADDTKTAFQCGFFWGLGCLFFTGAFDAMDGIGPLDS